MWHDLPPALWMALVGVGQPFLMAWIYRRRLNHTGWAPESQQDVAALLFAAVSSSLLLALVGGFPTLNPGDLPTAFLWWWVLRNTVFCFVGGVTFMVMFYGPRHGALAPTSWLNRIGLAITTFVCVYGSYHDPSLPLSWLLIIPSVWGGLTLTVRGTGYLCITLALAAASMSYLPQNQFGYDGAFPASSIMDLLVIACTAFFLLLALMREQRAALIAELDRKGVESENQRRMLETVFDSMSDGVVIVDNAEVSMYNAAARQLLGRPMPGGNARLLGRATSGCPPPTAAGSATTVLRDALWVEADDPAKTLQVRVEHDGSARILDITAQPIGSVRRTLHHGAAARRHRPACAACAS